MPNALNARETLSLQFWRDPGKLHQNRPSSSTQQARRPTNAKDERTSAILHGGQRLQHVGLHPGESLSNTLSPSQVLHATLQQRKGSGKRRKPSHTGPDPRSSPGRPDVPKQRAKKAPAVRPAQNRRGRRGRRETETEHAIELKDENYLRNHMHVPTAVEYPEIPPRLFESPRSLLREIRGKSKPVFSRIGERQGFRCKLKCKLNELQEVFVGEGQDKVP